MSANIVIDNEFATLWYHTETKIVHHQFHKALSGAAFRKFLSTGTAVMKENNARKWLSDDRNYSALPQADMEWGFTQWGPKNVLAGWRFWAIVLPKSFVDEMSIRKLESTYSSFGVVAKVFTNPEDAMTWLEAQS